MRIIAGVAKGRPIDAVASVTRPTSDRAREALFSTLVSEFGDFAELRILDLYAGTGAIALEALSRGASLVHAVEKDEKAARAITENYEGIKSAHFPGLFHLYSMSVHRFLQDKAALPYHFIYIDPPFDVGADFSMDIEIGEDTFTKKPNILEKLKLVESIENFNLLNSIRKVYPNIIFNDNINLKKLVKINNFF